ncbi:MAG: hypothetical protein ACYCVD_12995 [Desulfitobacteriaceae bacterium]
MLGIQEIAPVSATYHFAVNKGILSVVQGDPGQEGAVMLTGLDIRRWPEDIRTSAQQFQFNSLDEVQFFIDSVTEPLWTE